MSTPEERLKRLADDVESQHEIRQRREQEEAAKQRDEAQRLAQDARKEGQAWLDRTQSLVAATGKRVPFFLEPDRQQPGFSLTVGTTRVQASLRSDGWHIVKTVPDDLHSKSGLPVANFALLRERLLELMVQQGLRDLYEGRVSPAPDQYRRG